MFKTIKKSWYKINETKTLVEIRIGDVLFTPFKRKAKDYNNNFPNNLSWTNNQNKLREDILKGNYDPTNQISPISITKDGVCVNGHHRLTSLLKHYGEDYRVMSRKLDVNYRYVMWLTILTLIFQPKLFKGD